MEVQIHSKSGDNQRIGFGYDVHRLEKGRTLVLGGIVVSTDFGPVAHSDGDVLLHAVCDALLGAAALGDIGTHFPDSDPAYKDISSLRLLEQTGNLLRSSGYQVSNIDATIILERPKIMPLAGQMRANIAECLAVPVSQISVKATTSEGLGFVGEGRGIVSSAVAMVVAAT